MRIVNIWGLPLRFVNWSLAILLATCFLTAGAKGITHAVHVGAGYALSVALIYRIVLGFIGSPTARFKGEDQPLARITDQLSAFIDYRTQRWTGHSPIGSLAAMVMTFLLVFAAISGMIALNGADASSLHAAAGLSASLLGITWLGFVFVYQIFYDGSTLRTILSGRRIISDENRGTIAIPRLNRVGMNQTAFVWTLLISAAILPLTYVAPDTTVIKHQNVPAVETALMDAPYLYNDNRADPAVMPRIHAPVFAVNKVRVTWQPSLKAGLDYARPGFIAGASDYMMANTPDEKLGSIETAAGDESFEETLPDRAAE